MREWLGVIAGISLVGFCFLLSPLYGIAAWLFVSVTAGLIIHLYDKARERRWLNGLIDDLYILSDNPEDGRKPVIPRVLDQYVVVSHKEFFKKVEEYQEKLEGSGNPLYLGIDEEGRPIPEDKRIKVRPLPFRHGIDVNEYWSEYLQRCEDTITSDRSTRHNGYAQDAIEWYIGAHHKQNRRHLKNG